MRYPAIIAAIALALVAVGLMARNANLPYSTESKEALELHRQGLDELNAFRFDRAVAALENAVAADPGFAMAHAALANALASQGERKRAEMAAARAESLAGHLRKPEERLLVQIQLSSRGLVGHGRHDSLMAEAIERLPRDPIVMDIRAQAAMEEGHIETADSLWSELLEIDPNYARAYNWLGYLAANAGDYETALANLRKYAYLAPNLANPHDSLGEILLRIGNYEEAEAELRRALELQPDFYYSLVNMAHLYIGTGRVAKAADLLAKLRVQFAGTQYQQQIDELTIQAYAIHGMEGSRRQAVAEYVRRHGDKPAGRVWRALQLVHNGQVAEGSALMDSAITAFQPKAGDLNAERRTRNLLTLRHSFAAAVARQTGDLPAVAEHYRQFLGSADWLTPHEQIPVRIALAKALADVAAWAEVLEQTAAIQQTNPRHIPSLAFQALAESALGQQEAARRTLALLRANLALADPDLPARAVADSLSGVLGIETGV